MSLELTLKHLRTQVLPMLMNLMITTDLLKQRNVAMGEEEGGGVKWGSVIYYRRFQAGSFAYWNLILYL